MVLAEDLRQAVLQAALQGKLTEQLETDSNVGEMLINIKKEKEKPLPEIQDEDIPFEIPENWIWVRLGDILRVSSGDGLTSKNMIEGNIPVYGGNGINGYHNKSNVDESTITIGRVGANCGAVHITEERAWVTDNAFIVSFLMKQVNMLYWAIILSSLDLGNNSKATAQPVISGKTIYPVLAPIPPIEEQQRIVDKINEIMPKIDEYEKIEKEVEALKKEFPNNMKDALLQAAMQGKLTEQLESDSNVDELLAAIKVEKEDLIAQKKIKKEKSLSDIGEEEIPFDVPENWRFVQLGEIALYLDAGKSPNCIKENVKGDEWGVITTTAIQANNFLENENKQLPVDFEVNKDLMVKVDDILITRAGPMNRTGIMCLVENVRFNLLLSDKTVRVNMDNKNINKKFIVNAVNAPKIRLQIINMMSGMDKQQVNISQEKIRKILIPFPPIEEQQRIVERLDRLLPLCAELKD